MTIKYLEKKNYRGDIDGLRAIAVIAVVIFHFGYLPNGYLGVDIFFVISGYLITKIIYIESIAGRFSIVNFYLRRIRRIIPLVLFFSLFSLIVGAFVMLPDDFENLAQSVVATNLFSNNLLLYITNGNYWDVLNEFKPLMHTWSLGIEEQYYLLYPFLFLLFRKKRIKFILPILIVLTVFSVIIYYLPYREAMKFYLLPFRFFELSIGGIGAILLKNKLIVTKYRFLILFLLLFLLIFNMLGMPPSLLISLICVLTLFLLITSPSSINLTKIFLENRIVVGIGKISFSIYMWHQVVISFTKYFIFQELSVIDLTMIFLVILLLSVATYHFIEQPFRRKNKVKTPILLLSTGIATFLITVASLLIYYRAGVLKDFPELNIKKENVYRNMHSNYVSRVNAFKKEFENDNKVNVLVVGDSFASDWTNVLLESNYNESIDIVRLGTKFTSNSDLVKEAEIIFLAFKSTISESRLSKSRMEEYSLTKFDKEKIWCIGTKNFGINNGIFYNYKGEDYCTQRTQMEIGYVEENNILKAEWKLRYIDIIGLVADKDHSVPVFTPDCKFISQDGLHLTEAGAKYIANLIEKDSDFILNKLGLNN